ncbi:530_t:CDS:2 [Acaulospora morrowiae]|uniref:530_t:CDS:1 n=1 Tax=Acaulospora morrowiae TaxID=94023 RepID=A0A9N8Z1J6_9GLOM|nr:530_t:CDS:2 [Acaulospora morrowiae]
MTMAPINRFQHAVSSNFDELVFGNKQEAESNPSESRNSVTPQRTEESKKYIKEFLSKVRPELLKKRGMKTIIPIKDLMRQSVLTRMESIVDAMEVDNDQNRVEKMDWMKIENDEMVNRETSRMTELSVDDDTLNLLADKSKVWMKLLQFGEDKRPAYYGTWTKTSKKISARNPFAKDTDIFDYDYDSEAEWVEDEGDECKSDEEEKEPEEEDSQDDDWIVPNGYLSEDEIHESDESFSSPSSPAKKLSGSDKPKIVDVLRPVVIGPVFEEYPGVPDHQLSQYSARFLSADVSAPYNVFTSPPIQIHCTNRSTGQNKRKVRNTTEINGCNFEKEQPLVSKQRDKGRTNRNTKIEIDESKQAMDYTFINEMVI